MLERLGEHGLRVEVAVEHPQVEESVHVGEERGERAARGEPDLLGLRVRRRERPQDLAAAVAASSCYPLASQGMSGTLHCCHATHCESVVNVGSKQKSASPDKRRGQVPSSASVATTT